MLTRLRLRPSAPLLALLASPLLGGIHIAQVGSLADVFTISREDPTLAGLLPAGASIGNDVDDLGDVNGDGTVDFATSGWDAAGGNTVYILLMNADGSVLDVVEIPPPFVASCFACSPMYGRAIAGIGDLDLDGVPDLLIGDPWDSECDTFGYVQGALWIMFLNADGSMRSYQRISGCEGGLPWGVGDERAFGSSACCIGDVDGDGIQDLAIGAPTQVWVGVGTYYGYVGILMMNRDGTVKSGHQLASGGNEFNIVFSNLNYLGRDVAPLGDLDGNGIPDLAVNAARGSEKTPSLFLISLNRDGSVKLYSEVSKDRGGYAGYDQFEALFGSEMESISDVNGDGLNELLVSVSYGSGSPYAGARGFVLLTLSPWGIVTAEHHINEVVDPLFASIGLESDSYASIDDFDADGLLELVVGDSGSTLGDPSGVQTGGALHVFSLESGKARNELVLGSGVNPACFSPTAPPVLGGTWSATVDTSAVAAASSTWAVGHAGLLDPPFVLPFGEVLVDVTLPQDLLSIVPPSGGSATHSVTLPLDLSLVGFRLGVQAVIFGGPSPVLCNAMEAVLGY